MFPQRVSASPTKVYLADTKNSSYNLLFVLSGAGDDASTSYIYLSSLDVKGLETFLGYFMFDRLSLLLPVL